MYLFKKNICWNWKKSLFPDLTYLIFAHTHTHFNSSEWRELKLLIFAFYFFCITQANSKQFYFHVKKSLFDSGVFFSSKYSLICLTLFCSGVDIFGPKTFSENFQRLTKIQSNIGVVYNFGKRRKKSIYER